jgi:hypothetical protein
MIAISEIKKEYGDSSIALVVLCCRIHFKTAEISDLKDFVNDNDIDWGNFIKLCRKHRIRPLVYRIILKTNLPREIQEIINRELIKLTIKSLEQAKETERVILLLNTKGINVIPYKGTAFSKQFFGNINMRESSDIDLIISPEDLPMTIKILENDNYIASLKDHYEKIGHEKYIKCYKDFCFAKFNNKVREHYIEFHFNIITKKIYIPISLNIFNTNLADTTSLIKEEIKILNPAEHFKAIILHHMLMDNMGYLKTIVDVTQALNELKLNDISKDSNSIELKILRELNSIYNLEIVTSLINDLIGIEFKLNNKKKTKNNILTKRILYNSYRKVRENKIPIWNALTHHSLYIKYTALFYNKNRNKFLFFLKVSYFIIINPQPSDYKLLKLSKSFYFLYFLIRPFRVIFFPSDPNKYKKPPTSN